MIYSPKHKTYNILFGLLYIYKADGFLWFRICGGVGLHFKNIQKHQLTFSERQRIHKRVQINNWIVRILKAGKL